MIGKTFESTIAPFDYPSFATAPVRTRPERTYNPIDRARTSEGSHIPMYLAKTRFTDRTKWESLKRSLDSFGRSSGLFEEISLKTLGRSDSDPFQIMIKISGPRSNLIDVGYGVSQVLPIITDIIMEDESRMYLLQQPEVHLHPRAQASLASFFSSVICNSQNKIILETHSDYILDRVLIEIRDGKTIKPSDVSLLYFERNGRSVDIHEIPIDENGNLKQVPSRYREFFMKEEARLMGMS